MTRTMRWLVFAVIAAAISCKPGQATTYPAASCNESDVQAAYDTEQASPADGDIISIPAGTCTWTSTWTISPANSLTFQGAGAESATSGGASVTGTDQTIINVNVQTYWSFTTASGKSYRITGLAIYMNGAPCCSDGAMAIYGSSQSFRLDHNHFVCKTSGYLEVTIYGSVLGVADHNVIEEMLGDWIKVENGRAWNGDATGHGDNSWADSS